MDRENYILLLQRDVRYNRDVDDKIVAHEQMKSSDAHFRSSRGTDVGITALMTAIMRPYSA